MNRIVITNNGMNLLNHMKSSLEEEEILKKINSQSSY